MKKKWWQNPTTVRRVILLAVNIIAPFLIWFAGMGATGANPQLMYPWMICGEIAFIAVSLVIYYLAVIAGAVGKMAKSSEKDED